jgi:hypothetical protein
MADGQWSLAEAVNSGLEDALKGFTLPDWAAALVRGGHIIDTATPFIPQ